MSNFAGVANDGNYRKFSVISGKLKVTPAPESLNV
jgi:hypothetical protein